MYFASVLFAPSRLYNDISLMNFPILPRGDLYVLRPAVFRSAVVYVSPPLPFGCRSFQSCLSVLPASAGELPVSFGTAKVGNLF